jgi:6-phosphogluconolactonase (cycloisomerase 2 family)
MPPRLTNVRHCAQRRSGFLAAAALLVIAGCGGGGGDVGVSTSLPSATADNTPRFAYAIDDSVIGAYVVDVESGNLIPRGNSQRFFETSPNDIAARPDGKFLYISDAGGLPAIKIRKLDAQTGIPSPAGADFAVGTNAQQIAIHPTGKYLFYRKSGSNPVTTLALDASTGGMSLVGATAPLSTSGMHLAPDGKYLYTTMDLGDKQIQTFRVAADGSLEIVDADPGTPGDQPQVFAGVAEPSFNPINGDIYLVDLAGSGSIDRYARDASNGLLSFIDNTLLSNAMLSAVSLTGMHVEPLGRFGYVQLSGNLIAGFSIDPGDGTLEPIDYDPAIGGIQHLDFGSLANSVSSISFEPSGHFAYFGFKGGTGTIEKFAIDQISGMLSQSTSKPELNRILALDGPVDGIVFTNRTNVPAPQPTYAYSQQSGLIGIHRVDPATGLLTDIGTFATPAYQRLHLGPAQQYMYLGEAAAYARVRIDQETGALSDREQRTNAAPNNAEGQGVRFDPHNRFAVQTRTFGDGMDLMEVVEGPPAGLGSSKTDVQFTKDPYAFTSSVGASAVRPNSRQLYSTGLIQGTTTWMLRLFNLVATPVSFDRVDADAVAAGHQDFPISDGPLDTVVDPLGRYLLNLELHSVVGGATNIDNLAVYELDWITGRPTRRNSLTFPLIVPNHTTGSNPRHIALDPRGRFVYVPTDGGIAAFTFTRSPTGPALEAIDADPGSAAYLFQTLGGNSKLTIDPTGQWLYSPGSGGTEGFRIDQTTGALTSIGIVSSKSIVQVMGRL